MTRFIRIAVLVGGTSLLAGAPAFAQDLNALNPLPGLSAGLGAGLGGLGGGLGIDLDPFHIFTPAPPPPAPPGPIAEGPAPHAHHRHLRAHHVVAHHHLKAHHKVKAKTEKGAHGKKS